MTDKELEKIINELEERNEKDKAYFGFYKYEDRQYENYIKANRKGLELFAVELLKAAIESENREYKENIVEPIGLDISWTDENSTFFFDYVELTNKEKETTQKFPEYKDTWKDLVYKVGCVGILLMIIGLILIGLITTLTWI